MKSNNHLYAIGSISIGIFLLVSINLQIVSPKTHAKNPSNDAGEKQNRAVLPPSSTEFKGKIEKNYRDSTPDWKPALPLNAPKEAPNIILVVLDDVGYGHLGCYGGPINTPNIDKLAKSGLRYNNFHTTALCSPSRGVLLTGRNHHSIGLAAITEGATGFPGNYGNIPKSAAMIPEILKQNGYNTMAVGKWHLAPYTAYTAAGPFDRWPLGMGFEKYYGFLGGETDQWAPLLCQDNHFIDTPTTSGYHLTEDLVDRSIKYIRDQQQANTGRPFFTYLALGACHAPLHAPKEFIAKYQGKFDQGWDKIREETFERQKAMGIIPSNSVLPPANPGIEPWNNLNDNQKKVYTRLQEVFAGFLDHADHNLGRLIESLEEMKIRDNTLIMVVSDNGASQEGLQNGTLNTDRYRNFFPDTIPEMIKNLEQAGSPSSDPHYPMGWAMAGNTPFKRWKQDTHAGGNTDPFIVSWPAKIKDGGSIRTQYHHLVDVVPTILELSGLPAPTSVNGVSQLPIHGTSMAYTFTNANAKTTKKVQYYEMLGSRAIWSEGWTAVTWHKKDSSWDDDIWELYSEEDFTQSNNLATKQPEKLSQLQKIWQDEAIKHNVFPLDDRRYERAADPTRPVAALPKKLYTFYPGTSILHPLAAPQILGREHIISAKVEIPQNGADGVLACSGGEFGGWSLFLKDKKLHFTHNYLKLHEFTISSPSPITSGSHTLSVHFTPKSKNSKPNFFTGDIELSVDGNNVAQTKDIKSAENYSTMTGFGLLIGRNLGTPVSQEYKTPFNFTGKIEKVTIEIK
ncbi:MAG: arylsulfatase [Gemmataceae bacterium]